MTDHSLSSLLADGKPSLDAIILETGLPEPVQISSSENSTMSSAGKPQPLALRVFRPVRLAKMACVVGLAVFLPYLMQRLPDLNARPEYRLKTTDIRLIPAPASPIPSSLIEQIRLQNHLPPELSLLDPKLCETLADAFSSHPWIARVVSVQKSFPATVVVQVEYRRPVAMVQVKGGRVPIDATGTILPSEDFGVSDVANYPTIRLIGSSSLTRREGRFTEPGLTGAVQIAERLSPKWNSLGLEAIELPRTGEQPQNADDVQFQIFTKVGSSILWGRAPETDHPGELTATQKIARLEKYLTEFGGFDRPSGPYEIDIRHWQEITRRPVGKVQTSSRRDWRIRR